MHKDCAVAKAMAGQVSLGMHQKHFSGGAPRRSRTTNLQIRSLTLYPVELWALIFRTIQHRENWWRERDSNPRAPFPELLLSRQAL